MLLDGSGATVRLSCLPKTLYTSPVATRPMVRGPRPPLDMHGLPRGVNPPLKWLVLAVLSPRYLRVIPALSPMHPVRGDNAQFRSAARPPAPHT